LKLIATVKYGVYFFILYELRGDKSCDLDY